MATTKLGLPTITGNLSADIPRDLNALAEAVDSAAGTSGGLATLGADGKVPSSQLSISSSANRITVTDSGSYFTSSHVEGALQEIGQTLNGVRGNLIESTNNILNS